MSGVSAGRPCQTRSSAQPLDCHTMLRFVPFALCVVVLTAALIYSGSHAVPFLVLAVAWPLILWVWTHIEPNAFAHYVVGPTSSFLYSLLLFSPLLTAAIVRKWWPSLVQIGLLALVMAAFFVYAARSFG